MIGLQSRNIVLIFGTTIALLVSTSSSQMISASVEGGTPVPNTSKSNQSAAEGCSPMDPRCNTDISCEEDPYKCAGQSQGSSQGIAPGSNTSNSNQGAGSASQCTGTNPHDPPLCPGNQPNNADVSCETDPEKCVPPNNAERSQGGSQGTASGSSNSGVSSNPNQQAIDHISQAQSSLQNGDTEGAQRNMDLAKQALICNPGDPSHC